jgi:hypothetical protein
MFHTEVPQYNVQEPSMKTTAFGLTLLPCLLLTSASAATKTFDIQVAAGKYDRHDIPVCVPLALPADLAAAKTVTLLDPKQMRIASQLTAPSLLPEPTEVLPGQVRRELHFILPSLKAGESITLKAAVSTASPAPEETSFSWHDQPGEYTELRFGSRPVLRYMYKALDDSSKEQRELTFKVFHHLFDPSGQRLVTKGPPGGLYPHHRGLFYGFNKVTYGQDKLVDIWHCKDDTYMGHEELLLIEAGPVLGRHRLQIGWHGKGKELFAKEERELTVYHVPGGQLVEFASRLRTVGGPVKLDGDPQHAGFHFRADNEVASKTSKQTYFLRPDGAGKTGETRNWPKDKEHVNLPWDAMCFFLGSERFTVAYLDKPTNPKEARFSEREYGRIGSYFVYEVTEKKPLAVNYRIWLQKGEMTREAVAAKSASFTEPVVVTVK